jgi:hypothetical protein
LNVKDVEFALTIAVIPATILFLYITWICVKRESTIGMSLMIVIFFAGMAYFLFKLVRMYQPSQEHKYSATRKTLTTFAVITLLLLVITIANAIVCTRNFGYGLKEVINNRTNAEPEVEKLFPMNSMHLNHQQAYTRMTIE